MFFPLVEWLNDLALRDVWNLLFSIEMINTPFTEAAGVDLKPEDGMPGSDHRKKADFSGYTKESERVVITCVCCISGAFGREG